MKRNSKRFLSLMLSVCMTLGLAVVPVSAAPEKPENAPAEAKANKAEKKISKEDIKDRFGNMFHSDLFNMSDVNARVMAVDEDVEVDNADPAIQAVEEELGDITVLDESGRSVALTDEQIQQALGLYQQYLQQWKDNADVLGVQNPFYLSYNDTKDGLGILGEMLVLAGVSVDDVRSGAYSFDDLTGMIMNFYYGDQFGIKYYRQDIIKKRDEAVKTVKDSGAKTDVQKLLVLNDWLAQNDSFDMSYIMNQGKDEPVMKAEKPVKYEHYDEIYKVMFDQYHDQIKTQFHDQFYAGVVADMRQKFYEGAVKNIAMAGGIKDAYYQGAYQNALEQTEGDEEAAKAIADEATNKFMQDNAEAIQNDPVGLAKTTFGDDAAAQIEAGADGFVKDNADAIKADPHAFLAGMVGEDTAAQIDAQADGFIKMAETEGVEVDPVNAPGYKMTIEQIVQDTMKNQKVIDIDGNGTMVTPNDAIEIYTDGAATQLTNGIIGYWEGNQIGVFSTGKSVCMGYSKAFAYLLQYMSPEIYGKNGANTDMSKAANWKEAKDIYYNEAGELDPNQNYNVDLVRITYDAEVTMYGEPQPDFGADHFWNAVKVDGKWYYVDPCYTDVFSEVMNRDRVETDGYLNHMYFLFSDETARNLYDGYYKGIATLYQNFATNKDYEDAWVSRVKSNACTDGSGNFYYVYDSTDLISMLDDFNNSQNNYNGMEVDDAIFKLVRHAMTDVDTGDGDSDYDTLIEFNYRENEDDDTTVARVFNPNTNAMEENALLTKLYAQFAEERGTYPSIAITAAYKGGKVYFNLSNCILSYDVKSGEVVLVKEYNTVYGKRDKTNAFGGMAFDIVDNANNADFTVQNHPIAGISLKNDGKLYVSVATNFAYISGKDPHNSADGDSYGYEFEESNYNPSYSTYGTGGYSDSQLEQFGYKKEINDNDEFMWVANFVGAEDMAHLSGTSHNWKEVTVEPSCGRNGYTEERCSTCGASHDGTREEVEDSACDHHYIYQDETYYTKDKNGNWNKGNSYVCTICSFAIGEPIEPGNGGMGGNNQDQQEQYKKQKEIYDAAAASAGHTYAPTDAVWAKDFSTVTFSKLECTSVCKDRQKYLDALIADGKVNVTIDKTTVNSEVADFKGDCMSGPEVTYKAAGKVGDYKYEVTTTEKRPAGEHAYEGKFNWEKVKDDEGKESYKATATLTCAICGDVRKDVEAKVVLDKEQHVDPKCEEAGKDVYVATATALDDNGKTIGSATDTKEVKLPATGHSYNKDGICDICGAEEPSTIIEVSGGTWYHDSTGWWYALKEGGYLKDCKAKIDGSIYMFKANGYIVTGWVYEDGDWYYYKPSGAMAIGWVLVSGKWYYMTDKGIMVTGKREINGTVYYFNTNGTMVTGWRAEDGDWYYHDANGLIVKGWLQLGSTWYYLDPSTGVMATGTKVIGNATYRFTANGYMMTGWVREDGKWYYHQPAGHMAKGWAIVGSTWYFLDKETGVMHADEWLDGVYYLKSSGAMAVGWTIIDGDYYYFNGGGVKVCNQWVGNYYLKADGKMAKDEWVDNGRYYVDSTGKWIPGKTK